MTAARKPVPPLTVSELAEFDQACAVCSEFLTNLQTVHRGEISDGIRRERAIGSLAAVLSDHCPELVAFTLAIAVDRAARNPQ